MEALGVAATVSGIIQLAVYGVQTIQLLREFLRGCEGTALADFFQGLTASSRLLSDVQSLCERVRCHPDHNVNQITTTTLHLHLEDCVRDLTTWHNIARDIERRGANRKNNAVSSGKWSASWTVPNPSSSPSQKFRRFLRAGMKAIQVVATSDARDAVQERFQRHVSNITVALTIFQTDLTFLYVENVSRVEVTAQKLKSITDAIERKRHASDSDRGSSNSSNPVRSISVEKRLQELETLSSVSEKLDLILKAISSHGSSSSLGSLEQPAGIGPTEHNTARPGSNHTEHEGLPESTAAVILDQPSTDRLSIGKSQEAADRERVDSDDDDDGELRLASRLVADTNLLIGQIFAGVIADYAFAAERWRLSTIRADLLELAAASPEASRIQMDLTIDDDPGSLAKTLLSLRQRAEEESLQQHLAEADRVLGIDDTRLSIWKTLAGQKQDDMMNKGYLSLPASSRTQAAESLVRLDEWFLGVMMANPYLRALHRNLISDLMAEPQNKHEVGPIGSKLSFSIGREDWERLTLKFWLLDGASNDVGGYATSLAFTQSRESELTVLAANLENDGQRDEATGMDSTLAEDLPLMRQPYMKGFIHLGGVGRLANLNTKEIEEAVNMPPPHSSPASAKKARRTLLAYQTSL